MSTFFLLRSWGIWNFTSYETFLHHLDVSSPGSSAVVQGNLALWWYHLCSNFFLPVVSFLHFSLSNSNCSTQNFNLYTILSVRTWHLRIKMPKPNVRSFALCSSYLCLLYMKPTHSIIVIWKYCIELRLKSSLHHRMQHNAWHIVCLGNVFNTKQTKAQHFGLVWHCYCRHSLNSLGFPGWKLIS